jgi:mannose-6-phosphate isomerase-like protein (cupin superfamily)
MKEALKHMDGAAEYYFEEGCYILELLNSSEEQDLSIARARVKPGVTTVRHCLLDTAERYVILEGRGRVEVGELPPEEVAPGDVVLIPAFCPQRITNMGDVDLVFLAICTPRFTPRQYQRVAEPVEHLNNIDALQAIEKKPNA